VKSIGLFRPKGDRAKEGSRREEERTPAKGGTGAGVLFLILTFGPFADGRGGGREKRRAGSRWKAARKKRDSPPEHDKHGKAGGAKGGRAKPTNTTTKKKVGTRGTGGGH